MEYSLPKEHCRFISSLNPACHCISEAGSLGSLPHCDKSPEHCLLGKLSETVKTAMLFPGAAERKRERKIMKYRETERGEILIESIKNRRSSVSVGDNSSPPSCIVTQH